MAPEALIVRPDTARRPPAPPARRTVALKRVLAVASNLEQASARLRVAALVEPLLRRGFDVELRALPKPWQARRALLRSAGGFHAVLLHRKLLDPWNWDLLRRHARRVVYDVDDAVLYAPAPVGWYSRWRTALRFDATTRRVDHVAAGNPYLADLFRRRGCRRVSVVPTAIYVDRYAAKVHAPTDGPRLVWIGSR